MNATKQDLDPAASRQRSASATAAEFEGEMREFLRRDISIRDRPQTSTTGDTAAEDMNSSIQRVSVSSIEEIECVISELQAMRDSFRTEGDRVQRATTNYAGMSQAATTSMRIIADGLLQLKTPIPQINRDPR